MLGEFKTDQFFVEKTKLANNLYVENLNHLSWHKSPTNYVHQIISKITENFKMINSFLKKLNSQTICIQKIRIEMTVYLQILLQNYP